MSLNVVPKREGPKEEISTPVEPHNRVWTGPRQEERKPARSPQEAAQAYFAEAQERISKMNPATAVEFLGTLPTAQLEMYLLAEEVTQNRDFVLRFFPKPGHRARQRFLPEPPKTPRSRKAPVAQEVQDGTQA